MQSSMVTFLTGINGQTSVAPRRACVPLCFRISIIFEATLIAWKAASSTEGIDPTNVTTVLLVSTPDETSNNEIPEILLISETIRSILFESRPSLKFGTHSTNCCIISIIN